MHTQTNLAIIRRREVEARTGLSRSAIYQKLREDPTFPKPIHLSSRAIGWVESEINDWIAAQIRKSRNGGRYGA